MKGLNSATQTSQYLQINKGQVTILFSKQISSAANIKIRGESNTIFERHQKISINTLPVRISMKQSCIKQLINRTFQP